MARPPAVSSFESVSTWSQPEPAPASVRRSRLVAELAGRIVASSPGRLRVVIDGRTAAGKTSFGHELASAVRLLGRPTLRASLDDFKNPWPEAFRLGYDRTSGPGFYRNAWDFTAARELLLTPAGPGGSGEVVLCARDPHTGADHGSVVVQAPEDAVLVVDGVFAFRPEYDEFWDHRVWLEVGAEVAIERGIARDTGLEGVEEATRLHRDRYLPAEEIYLAEIRPAERADFIIDNTDFANPVRK